MEHIKHNVHNIQAPFAIICIKMWQLVSIRDKVALPFTSHYHSFKR